MNKEGKTCAQLVELKWLIQQDKTLSDQSEKGEKKLSQSGIPMVIQNVFVRVYMVNDCKFHLRKLKNWGNKICLELHFSLTQSTLIEKQTISDKVVCNGLFRDLIWPIMRWSLSMSWGRKFSLSLNVLLTIWRTRHDAPYTQGLVQPNWKMGSNDG